MAKIAGAGGDTARCDARGRRCWRLRGLIASLALLLVTAQPLRAWELTGDQIQLSLATVFPSETRGRAIVASRQTGLCILCHNVPILEATQQGNIGPNLAGVGKRLSVPQLRAWLVAPRQIKPTGKMPSYLQVDGLNRVNPMMRGSRILNEQQIEDVLAYLATLTDTDTP